MTTRPRARRSRDPTTLNVGGWLNLYTTGDYVGRSLWRGEDWPGVWNREGPDEGPRANGRRERCLGAGTHTHYWTSVDVAQELDALIGSDRPTVPPHGAVHAKAPPTPPTSAANPS